MKCRPEVIKCCKTYRQDVKSFCTTRKFMVCETMPKIIIVLHPKISFVIVAWDLNIGAPQPYTSGCVTKAYPVVQLRDALQMCKMLNTEMCVSQGKDTSLYLLYNCRQQNKPKWSLVQDSTYTAVWIFPSQSKTYNHRATLLAQVFILFHCKHFHKYYLCQRMVLNRMKCGRFILKLDPLSLT